MKIFIDLGAFNGDTIELALHKFNPKQVYAFEPLSANFSKLAKKFGSHKNIFLENAAADIENAEKSLYLGKEWGELGGSLLKEKTTCFKDKFEVVKTMDFSGYMKEHFSKKDKIILKIDIEGKEYEVLDKMIRDGTIKYAGEIYCEWHYDKIGKDIKEHRNFIKRLRRHGSNLTGSNLFDEFSLVSNIDSGKLRIKRYKFYYKEQLKEFLRHNLPSVFFRLKRLKSSHGRKVLDFIRGTEVFKFFRVIFHTRYKFNKRIIEINLTNACNLKCVNCASSCRQATDDEYMSARQVEFFVAESISNDWGWRLIKLYGGEPTLNPELAGIIAALEKYRNAFAQCRFQILTNGCGKEVREKLATLPDWIEIVDSHKEIKDSESRYFESYNVAPRDLKIYRFSDYAKGCFRIEQCGIGLSTHGYYPCAPGFHVDRVFGFDLGIDNLKSALSTSFKEEMQKLCSCCGLYKQPPEFISEEWISPSWKAAYAAFKKNKPRLKNYGPKS